MTAGSLKELRLTGVEALRANKERINKLGMEPTGTTPAELAAIMKADREKWASVVKASVFTPAK